MTTPATPEPDGSYRILSVTGKRNKEKITELIPDGELLTGRGQLFSDNRLRPLSPFVGEAGFIYRTSGRGYFNVCHSDAGGMCGSDGYSEYSAKGSGRPIELRLSRSPLPEISATDAEAVAMLSATGATATSFVDAPGSGSTAGATTSLLTEAPLPPGTVKAVWVQRKITFRYTSSTTIYNCRSLQDKIRRILKEIGSLEGSKVLVNCANIPGQSTLLPGLELNPKVQITAAVPRQVTPDLIERLAKGQTKRDLIAKVRGLRSVVDNPETQFPARARRVTFDDNAWGDRMTPGDCELLEQLRDQVFVPLGIRVVDDSIHCVPGMLNRGSGGLEIEVLEPWKDDAPPAEQSSPRA
jgi:hypothetical protein